MKHLFFLTFLLVAFSVPTRAETIDPELLIKTEGYEHKGIGDDGKSVFYVLGKTESPSRIEQLEKEITGLPKDSRVFAACDLMRGGAKAKLIEQSGIAYDVAVANYGYDGSTIVCVLKFMINNSVGTQISYSKKGRGGMYMVFIKS